MYSLVKYILFISFSIILFSCSASKYGVRQKDKPYSRFSSSHYDFKR